MKKFTIVSVGMIALPLLASAQTVDAVIFTFGRWVNTLTGILASLGLLVFFWGVVKYIAAAGDEKSKEQGKRVMVGGVIALFVLFSVFGLVRFLQRSFNLDRTNQMTPPRVNFNTNSDPCDDPNPPAPC